MRFHHFLLTVLFCFSAAVSVRAENIALGKKYALTPTPNLEGSADDGDAFQLTDGETTQGDLRTQKGGVGWSFVPWVDVTIDLERVEPIEAVAFHSAAGGGEIEWPAPVFILTSEEGKRWFFAGDLMKLDQDQNGPRDSTQYHRRRIAGRNLGTKGRFVKLFFLPTPAYVLVDEIEIQRGDAPLLERPIKGEPIEWTEETIGRIAFMGRITRRYLLDALRLTEQIKGRAADGAVSEKTAAKLAALANETASIYPNADFLAATDPNAFRTLLPFDAVHADLFARQAEYWRLSGAEAALTAERTDPFAFLTPVTEFPTGSAVKEPLVMARNEIRSAAFTLYNSSERPLDVAISLGGDFAAQHAEAVSVSEVPWTDTVSGIPVAAALVPVTPDSTHRRSVTVHPGLPAQIWLDIDSTTLSAKEYALTLRLEADALSPVTATLPIRVASALLPKEQTLLIGGWDYSDSDERFNYTAANQDSFLRTMKAFGVNAPWAEGEMMFADLKIESVDGKPIDVSFDTARADRWLSLWPDAKEFFVMLGASEHFGPFAMGTEEFDQGVALWAKKWENYFTSKGIAAPRVSLLLCDEPGLRVDPKKEPKVPIIVAWSKAIRASGAGFRIWEDPVFNTPALMPEELPEACDTLCPNRPQWIQNRAEFDPYFQAAASGGKEFQFYSCSGAARLLDPYAYYRMQAWHLFVEGGTASFFWAMGDGGGVSGWNEYLQPALSYSPMFLDPVDPIVTPAKQLAAIRESGFDFELLTLLRRKVEEGEAAGRDVSRGERLLAEISPRIVWAEGNDRLAWFTQKDRSAADRFRVEVLNLLETMDE